MSNVLKKMILPELEHMSGRKVIAQKIYLNIFPLFIEAKGVKIFDEDGKRVLTADRVKGYVVLTAIFRKELAFRRVVIKKPEIWSDKKQLDDIIGRVKDYLNTVEPNKIKVSANAIEVRDGEFSFYDTAYNALLTGKDIDGEVLLGKTPKMNAHIRELVSNIQSFPELRCEVDSTLVFKKDGIDVKNISLKSYGSEMRASGFYSAEGKGTLKASMDMVVDSVKKIFGLKRSGDGKISAKGEIKFGEGSLFVDIKLNGNFYLQSLMEILEVKERVEGLVNFDGKISGAISSITGSADARLRKGNLFGVDVDDLKCKVFYNNGVMSFKNGKGLLYNGRGEAEATLNLPKVEHYSLKVSYTDVDSVAALKLINVKSVITEGKVRGELYTSGSEFNPVGWFEYDAPPFNSPLAKGGHMGGDVPGRIKKVRGGFKVQGDALAVSNMTVRTEASTLDINGTVGISEELLNLKGKLETIDITDLTSPYFNRLKGAGSFSGTITGKLNDPLISGVLQVISPSFDDYRLESISGEFSYRKNLLDVKDLSAKSKDEQHSVRGSIKFDEAKEIFDLKHPDYKLAVSLGGADIEKLARIFYKKLPLKGRGNSEFKITGKGNNTEYSGSATINDAEAYKFPIDSLSTYFSYSNRDFIVKKATVKKSDSSMTLEGRITGRENFQFNVSADKLFLKDIGLQHMPADSVLSLKAEGSGTFDNPYINLTGQLSGGTFKGKPLGNGNIKASVRNKDILFDALLFNEKIKVKGNAFLDDKLPWTAEIDMLSGRYDFILAGILKDVPEDLLVNIKGHADLSGDKKHFFASAAVNQLNVALFGYSFSNDSDIKLKFENRNMSFSAFTMRSGNASFGLRGNMEIGKEYNMVFEGSSALSPLRGLSKRISVLRGDADFTLAIIGKWDNPQISGSLNVTEASFGLKDIHQRVSSINGYFYFEEDRIAIQKLRGKLGGGDIDVSGLIYLKGFSIKRFYLDARLDNITTSVSKDFTVNFDGDLLYKGTLESQNVTGDVKVNRARYRERVEWKSWLLRAKPKEKPKAELARIEKAGLNIKIQGSDNIIVDNNIASAPLKVDLVMRGTIGHPLLFGRIETKGGKVYFRNNEFRILNASADFADPNRINPLMEIIAQTIVKGYNIKLSLEGQLERFVLSLISDPPLEETDILSLLTVGQIGRELKGLEGGIGASEATAFLTGKVQDVFEDRLRNITGLDRVQVDPYVSKSTGTIGPRVTVSKRLLGDRLFVTYISPVGSTEEQVLKLEYILGKNVSLVGLRDEKGSTGGDIKFRFEFK